MGYAFWYPRLGKCNFVCLLCLFTLLSHLGVILHKKSGGWDALHNEIGSADVLPQEFGGKAGSIDNSNYLKALMNASDYYETLRECKQEKTSL